MTIIFTEKEQEYIDKIPFAWKVLPNCPESIKKTLSEKLKLLYRNERGEKKNG